RFEAVENSPVKLLGAIDQERLDQLQRDDGFLAHMDRVEESLNHYMSAPTWFQETFGAGRNGHSPAADHYRVAYFSAEFGLHESVPVYSGGLGVLAGDPIKSASDPDITLVGIGLFYGQGYFRQQLDLGGWQREEYLKTDVNQMPMEV